MRHPATGRLPVFEGAALAKLEPSAMETGPVTGITVTVGDPAAEGALTPRYDEESQILAVESTVAAEWPFGVDIDGRVVFDLASDRTLMNVDVHVSRKFWLQDATLGWPTTKQSGRLIFDERTVRTKTFHLALRISTYGSRLVAIAIGQRAACDGMPVALSDRCVAFHRNRELAGFVLRLE